MLLIYLFKKFQYQKYLFLAIHHLLNFNKNNWKCKSYVLRIHLISSLKICKTILFFTPVHTGNGVQTPGNFQGRNRKNLFPGLLTGAKIKTIFYGYNRFSKKLFHIILKKGCINYSSGFQTCIFFYYQW